MSARRENVRKEIGCPQGEMSARREDVRKERGCPQGERMSARREDVRKEQQSTETDLWNKIEQEGKKMTPELCAKVIEVPWSPLRRSIYGSLSHFKVAVTTV